MMKTYKANRKGFINYILIGFTIIPILLFVVEDKTFSEKLFNYFPLLIPMFLIIWIYFDTSYKIQDTHLIYRSGFLKGQIHISSITEILKDNTMWIGLKPALSKGGLIIKYNIYEDVYIAPYDNEEIISDLLKLNSNIKITV